MAKQVESNGDYFMWDVAAVDRLSALVLYGVKQEEWEQCVRSWAAYGKRWDVK